MKKMLTALAAILLLAPSASAKKVLDHDSFDAWKSVRIDGISRDGLWAAYEVNPQEGDGMLTLRNTKTGKTIEIPRGYMPRFTASSRKAVALIKPLFADTRQAKIKKKKDLDLPQDTLALIDLASGRIEKIPMVTDYKIAKDAGEWVAYTSVDTAKYDLKKLKDKEAGRPLVVRDMVTGNSKTINAVKAYVISDDGRIVATHIKPADKDTTATAGIGFVSLPDTNFVLVDRDKKWYGAPVVDRMSRRMAYTASTDSIKTGTRKCTVYEVDMTSRFYEPKAILSEVVPPKQKNMQRPHAADPQRQAELMEQWAKNNRQQPDTLYVNQYTKPVYSHSGRRLIAGVAPYVAPDDTTIVDFERADLDIWRWDAPLTPPQEKKKVDELRKYTYPVVIGSEEGIMQMIDAGPLASIRWSDRKDGDNVLITNLKDDGIALQWDYSAPQELKVLNVKTGQTVDAGEVSYENEGFSPLGRYVLKFNDRNYYAVDAATGQEVCISEDIGHPLWDEDQDIPMMAQPYGVAGWTDGDRDVLVYDRFDIWSLDPAGRRAPVNLTAGEGRKTNRKYRYIKTDPDEQSIKPGQEMLLSVFDYTDKRNGFATLKAGAAAKPALKVLDTYKYTQVRKAKDAPVYAWQRANFNTSPDVWIATGGNLAAAKKVTDANPQMKDYSWGDASLVKWYAYNGDLTEGVLYTPEDLDPAKKYPMLVVFYERNSEELYRHYTMEPSWSWVNYPFYVSRGYVVFVPDVKYTPGVPGESAYNYICSGVEDLCKKYPWIDKDRIGIDGQSWGGYQTAFLVTRTNMFACAGSGAPVANMTSAFGGIRWGTGDSRQAQYEKGQSRIGRSLWEAPQLYIANSPIFYADRVETPLLIMHNDGDGAVPWYQGIEMFMALRRLHKPVWMLQYNGEAHNIRERKNRKDITIRLQQFFDHYLKGAPMPEWMKNGIPATRKGQEMGTGLVTD